ncbi:uncharacterized protein SPPG_03263 [Spizellomyces punctatus DAOM BR117]|uniref:U2A'/phosphoprotein 32 family A C-terminal domain-containing protein n=1 Tax=Spizellomyces punctatus (strain DAOM BR117) TaxID=645134 RepID=A0A0L0HJ19_SPIPD|nr:uncharacterized protein SPPG_03263 [Spizellomyces punctatus DAOM BR117]KND01461.1 hypothetical protein SPPG_03263 [Spizellomyces punctatus DAOM BR117]|eukprot:XP_016609500.1 hypothetical protein SPPG_03263 [Spizellomyces punctatus DAOM BR117]
MCNISEIDGSLSSLQDLYLRLGARQGGSSGSSIRLEDVRELNVHSNRITKIDRNALQAFRSLVILDLSSNLIQKIEGLEVVPHLRELNLSNNKICRIENLRDLHNLRQFIISFNSIRTLEGLTDMHGNDYSLELLDLKGNNIDDWQALRPLMGCMKLKHLVLNGHHAVSKVNPICGAPSYSPMMVLNLLKQLHSVDGVDRHGIRVTSHISSSHPDIAKYADFVQEHQKEGASADPGHSVRTPVISAPSRHFQSGSTPSGAQRIDNEVHYLSEQLTQLQQQMDSVLDVTSSMRAPTQQRPQADVSQMENLYNEVRNMIGKAQSLKLDGGPTSFQNRSTGSSISPDRLTRLEKQMERLMECITSLNRDDQSHRKRDGQRASPKMRRESGADAVNYDVERQDDIVSTSSSPGAGENSDESEYTTLPTRIPASKNGKRQTLVWREQKPMHSREGRYRAEKKPLSCNSFNIKTDENSPESSKGKPTSSDMQGGSAVALAANAKLIRALEEEEKRLRANEKTYADEIKKLTGELSEERSRRQKAEDECMALKKQATGQAEAAGADKDKLNALADENSRLKTRLQEADSSCQSIASELSSVKADLNDIRLKYDQLLAESAECKTHLLTQEKELKNVKTTEQEIKVSAAELECQLKLCEEEKARLSVRLVKDREQSRVKVAEVKKENEIYKATIRQLQKENSALQQNLSSRDFDARQQLNDLAAMRSSELKQAISETTNQLLERHKVEYDAVSHQLTRTQHAYAALEEEFRKGMKEEQGRFAQLRHAYTELLQQFTAQAKALETASGKEKEMASVIKELTDMVKEQKARIADLAEKHQMTFTIFEDKVHALEDRLKASQKMRHDFKSLQSDYNMKQALANDLTAELQRTKAELAQQTTVFQQERIRLDSENARLQADLDRFRDGQDQAIRVKNKMLEDQNETIKNLKQNLENKCREHQALLTDIEKREDSLEDRLELEKQTNKDLQQELESQTQEIYHLQSIIDEYREERNTLRKDLAEASKKLKERNESIHMIEDEVAKIRKVFKAKEERWLQEKEEALKSQELANLELKSTYENQTGRLAFLERERDVMLQTIRKLQKEIEEASNQRDQHEAEMRIVLTEMDRQKQRMNEKMEKLKAAFAEA